MTRFVVYVESTGEIKRTGECPEWDAKLQAPGDDERVVVLGDTPQRINSRDHYVTTVAGHAPMIRRRAKGLAGDHLAAVPRDPDFTATPPWRRRNLG